MPQTNKIEQPTDKITRKTLWYHMKDVLEGTYCPSCGRDMEKFKMPIAHIKRCFSIRKVGTIYRLYGYSECKCGMLIADNSKAKKLHICVGEVPAFEPDSIYVKQEISDLAHPQADEEHVMRLKPVKALERELLQPKPWIRNFVSPIKFQGVRTKLKPKPRVRNFDMALSVEEPHDVWVYSITRENNDIAVRGRTWVTF